MISIAEATPDDAPLLLALVRELAAYERLSDEVVATEEGLRATLFGPGAHARAIVARHGGEPAGFAVWFHSYSTFLGRPGIHLEDLYVRQAFRGRGIGTGLLVHLARLAVERRCGRLEWAVLDWNAPSIEFYRALGAVPMDGWTTFRLSGEALAHLARRSGGPPGSV